MTKNLKKLSQKFTAVIQNLILENINSKEQNVKEIVSFSANRFLMFQFQNKAEPQNGRENREKLKIVPFLALKIK